MKVRTGFVSNSSSSSFIVGIGVVTDFNKFNSWVGRLNLNEAEDIQLFDITQERKRKWSYLNENSNNYYADEPTNYGGTVDLNKEAYEKIATERPDDIVVMCLGNNEGDSAFYPEDMDDFDYDLESAWDIDLDWFSTNQQKMYEGFCEENGISLVDKTYGAGRNG